MVINTAKYQNVKGSQDIYALRNTVLNYTLVIFSLVAFFVITFLFFVSFQYGSISVRNLIIYSASGIVLILIALFRKYLSSAIKSLTVIAVFFVVIIANFYTLGLFANVKILAAALPVFLSFILPLRKTLVVLVILVVIYGLFGYLHAHDLITFGYDIEAYALRFSSWVAGIAIMFFSSLSLLIVGNYFSTALFKNYISSENQNKTLQEKEKKNRLLFENSHDALVLLKDYKYFDCNKHTFALFDCPSSFLIGKYPWEVSPLMQPDGIPSKEKAERIICGAIEGQSKTFDWQHKRTDGSLFDVSISLNSLKINGEELILAILRDITQKKKSELELLNYQNHLESLVAEKTLELQAMNEELTAINEDFREKNELIVEQKNELEKNLNNLRETQKFIVQSEKMASIGVLTSGIAYEINNPINFISSGVTGLEMEIDEIIDALRELGERTDHEAIGQLLENCGSSKDIGQSVQNIPLLMSSIRTGVDRTINILKGLRTFSRMDDELKHLASLSEIIKSTLTILFNRYKERIRITTNFCPDDQLRCYPGKLGQLFLNIILNAIQAIKGAGQIDISTEFVPDKDSFKITITDSGPGIPPELHHKIFDPFFTTKPVGQGTGLGLSISLGIVNDHKGEIEFTSNTDRGTTFTIFLPKNS